jgi:hypothetical protein
MHPRLMPIKNIIAHLKEAAPQLPHGSYFPFKIHTEDWLEIEKHTAISAYCDKATIYTVLRFPLISQPTYDIINIIEFPTPSSNHVFTYIKIEKNIIAIDKEKLTYLVLTETELQKM